MGNNRPKSGGLVPTFSVMLWPTVRVLRDMGGSGGIQEINENVIRAMKFTEEQQSVLRGDGPETEIAYRLAWVRTYLKMYGALTNSARGVWSLTEKGFALTEAETKSIPNAVNKARRKASQEEGPEQADDEDKDEMNEESWKDKLLESLLTLRPEQFERLAQRLLREAGFINPIVTGRTGDGGIDGVGLYRLSLVSFPVFFQCKRYRGSVGASAVRDFRGAMQGRGDKGILITTGRFTSDASQEATRAGAPPIDLIDGEVLCGLLKQYRIGLLVRERVVEDITVDSTFLREL